MEWEAVRRWAVAKTVAPRALPEPPLEAVQPAQVREQIAQHPITARRAVAASLSFAGNQSVMEVDKRAHDIGIC